MFDTRNDLPAPTRHSALLNARLADAVDESAGFADADTSDRFTKILRGTGNLLWMVKAHVQK
jgi:DNA-binding ferritin-like protein